MRPHTQRTDLNELRAKRTSNIGIELARKIKEALHSLTIPSGWVKIVSDASITYRPSCMPIPSVKVHLSGKRIDVDLKVDGKITSSVYYPHSVPELVAQTARQVEQIS